MINLLKKLFGRPQFQKRGTGYVLNPEDYRDVSLAAFQKPVGAPDSFNGLGDVLGQLEVEDQGIQSSCVPHAIGQLLQAYIYRKTREIRNLSFRYGYKLCKMFDGLPYTNGTFVRIGALVATKFGFAREELIGNETRLTTGDYVKFEITPAMTEDAARHRMPGFAFVNGGIEAVKEAIYQNGAVCGATQVGDWSSLPVKAVPSAGYHYTLWYRYESTGNDHRIYFKNSWGKGWLAWLLNWPLPGYGYFMWSEHASTVRDVVAFADIPADYLNKVKSMQPKFTVNLVQGDSHPEIRNLQKMLNESPETCVALDGAGSPGQETSYFGSATRAALVKWQQKNGINPTGNFGPTSRAKANERIYSPNLTKWALAIQSFEGYAPGTRSFRNNNPGNIRYSGVYIQMAKAQDDRGFCVFDSYERGLDALKTLLLRAATGLSSVYSPEDTLLGFVSKYAPGSDGNHPETYAKFVAERIGVPVDIKIKELV